MGAFVRTLAFVLTVFALTSCSQADPAVPMTESETQESRAPAPSMPAPDPQTGAPEQTQGAGVFYLEAMPGCYGLSEAATDDYFIEAVGKEFFALDCSEPHHLEVFWQGDLPGFSGTKNLTQEDAEAACVPEYQKVFAQAPPSEVIPEEEQARRPYVFWFFPDDGLEASKYPGRLVCAAFESNSDYTIMKSRTGSLASNAT